MGLYQRKIQGYNSGFIFKSFINYDKRDKICYIPEYAYNGKKIDETSQFLDESYGYTRKDFERLCKGTKIDPSYLFEMVDWQAPETLLSEMLDNEENYDHV